ncbi:MAG TPA: D-alanine--D-alanine ligase family protein [Candidatus Saccharimonadales bacterium]|nr:D-alanine--D-alanine ligase family protein [Candidatus Saccharimonadales bacterium]
MESTETTQKRTVLVLFGGESAEHEVSILSAQNLYAALDTQEVVPILCYIDRQGAWWQADGVAELEKPTVPITPILGSAQIKVGEELVSIDVIFPVLHGTNGEDGAVQGLARLLHVPVVGCGLDGSVICIDKVLAKQLLEAATIPVVPYATFNASNAEKAVYGELASKLGYTLFVKPVRQGSSVGVHKVQNGVELKAAILDALQYDRDVLIESAVSKARELEVAVLGLSHDSKASVVGEIVPDRDFYDYASKYDSDSTSKVVIPAAISPEVAERIRAYAVQAFEVLHCQGLARIDFFLDGSGNVFLNEVNTMPGFTNISMYPKLWEATGLPYKQLVATLIDQAE